MSDLVQENMHHALTQKKYSAKCSCDTGMSAFMVGCDIDSQQHIGCHKCKGEQHPSKLSLRAQMSRGVETGTASTSSISALRSLLPSRQHWGLPPQHSTSGITTYNAPPCTPSMGCEIGLQQQQQHSTHCADANVLQQAEIETRGICKDQAPKGEPAFVHL